MTAVAAGAVLWYVDPPLRREDVTVLRDTGAAEASTASPEPGGFRGWFSPGLVALLLIAGCATIVLTGTDISLIALMRESESTALLGVVLAVWGLGSAIGGLVYGALRRPVPAWLLLLCLGAVTLPVGVAHTFAAVLSLVFVAGLLCAPTLTATIDELTGLIDPRHHGEALGWHGRRS